MRNRLVKAGMGILTLVLVLTLLSACGSREPVVEAVSPDANSVVSAPSVTFVADGREITLEDTAGKSLQQLLEQARITLEEGDLLAVSPEQKVEDTLVIQVLSVSASPRPTEPDPTEPEATEPDITEPVTGDDGERTVVSVEVYADCDNSGHGVKVITYSDGTQEEVYF